MEFFEIAIRFSELWSSSNCFCLLFSLYFANWSFHADIGLLTECGWLWHYVFVHLLFLSVSGAVTFLYFSLHCECEQALNRDSLLARIFMWSHSVHHFCHGLIVRFFSSRYLSEKSLKSSSAKNFFILLFWLFWHVPPLYEMLLKWFPFAICLVTCSYSSGPAHHITNASTTFPLRLIRIDGQQWNGMMWGVRWSTYSQFGEMNETRIFWQERLSSAILRTNLITSPTDHHERTHLLMNVMSNYSKRNWFESFRHNHSRADIIYR